MGRCLGVKQPLVGGVEETEGEGEEEGGAEELTRDGGFLLGRRRGGSDVEEGPLVA